MRLEQQSSSLNGGHYGTSYSRLLSKPRTGRSGNSLLGKLKELVHEGDIRRITLKNEEGHTLIEIPMTLGVVGALLLPVWAAIGAIAALAASLTIIVERTDAVLPEITSTNPEK